MVLTNELMSRVVSQISIFGLLAELRPRLRFSTFRDFPVA